MASLALALSAVVLLGARNARGTESLSNGTFDAWTAGGNPQSWSALSGSFQQETGDTLGGSAARVLRSGPTTVVLHSAVETVAGAELSGSLYVKGPDSATVRIQYRYLDSGFVPISTVVGPAFLAGNTYSQVSFGGTEAPARTEWVHFEVFLSGTGDVVLENASLDIIAPTPTSTPTVPPDTPTPTPTPADATAVPTPTTGGGGTPGTPSPTATRTATATRTPTDTRTSSPIPQPTATKTPTPPRPLGTPTAPLPTSTPTLPAGAGFGGLLSNGDFELVRDGKPAYWEKFGGTMLASGEAARGTYAGCLQSETDSTKWLYQVASVNEGNWYEASAQVSVTGGTGSIRVSWYASADGSGSQLSQAASEGSTSAAWVSLSTGPVQAPAGSQSARVRLVLQPSGLASACFDDATFVQTTAPPAANATPVPTGTATTQAANTSTPRPGTGTSVPRSSFAGTSPPAGTAAGNAGLATLRISEFMSDPSQTGRDAAHEWVELVNTGGESLDLHGWRLADGSAEDALPAMSVPAGGYVVLAGSSVQFAPGIAAAIVADGEIGNGLGNDGDLLRLIAPDGRVVDEVSYGDNVKVFEPAPPAPGPGMTLGAIDPAGDPASENWAVTRRPTPGEQNEFPPKAALTPGATPTAANSFAAASTGRDVEVEEDDDGGSATSWVVLGAIGGISVGIASAALAPKAREWRGRLRGR